MSESLNQPPQPSTPEETRTLVLAQADAIQQYLMLAHHPSVRGQAIVFGFAIEDEEDMAIIAAGDVFTLHLLEAGVREAIHRMAPLEEDDDA